VQSASEHYAFKDIGLFLLTTRIDYRTLRDFILDFNKDRRRLLS
jgi:hypothetical protein